MARGKALNRLQQKLVARRAELLRSLREELADLAGPGEFGQADSADAAFDCYADEVSSHLAELESAELAKIEEALQRIKEGRYGRCEICGGRIPAARLNALPFTSTCVRCQREEEVSGRARGGTFDGTWQKVYDSEVGDGDKEPDISGLSSRLELGLSGRR